jgi:hypothetical protein
MSLMPESVVKAKPMMPDMRVESVDMTDRVDVYDEHNIGVSECGVIWLVVEFGVNSCVSGDSIGGCDCDGGAIDGRRLGTREYNVSGVDGHVTWVGIDGDNGGGAGRCIARVRFR